MDGIDPRAADLTAPRGPAPPAGAYGRYAEVYDRVWARAPYGRFVDLCLEEARSPVRRVVVAACGTGNAAFEFARRGYRTAGFDLSSTMLAAAAAKRPPGASADFVRGDLRAVPFADGCADLVVALNSGLNYLLEADEAVTALAHLGRVAGPAGTVVVEPLSARFLHAGVEQNRHLEERGLRFDAVYETRGDLLVECVSWRVDGDKLRETYWQRWYDDDRLAGIFEAAGLKLAGRRPMWPAIPEEPARGRT